MKKTEIKYLFFIPLIYLSFFLFHKFIFVNIMTLDIMNKGGKGAVGLFLLALSILLAVFVICSFFRFARITIYKKSFLYLIVFFFYFILRILIDTQNSQTLKGYTIATTGGIILFYGLGVLFGLLIFLLHNTRLNYKAVLKWRAVFFLFYLTINLFSIMETFLGVSSIVRQDIFGLEDGANYQRIANFLIINTILLSILYFSNFIYLVNMKFLFKKSYLLLCFFAYFVYSILIIIFTQLVGSNNGFVTCSGILVLGFSLHIFIFISQKRKFILLHGMKFRNLFRGVVFLKFLESVLISVLSFFCVVVIVVLRFGIDISKIRILGYGDTSKGLGSLTSRFELLNNFYIHFSVSPFWGCMSADTLTTGFGSYVHSFIFSMITHMGLLGTGVFIAFFIQVILEYFHKNFDIYDKYKTIYEIFLLLGILSIAVVGVFFTWIPIWFLFGIIFKPVKVIKTGIQENIN
ncbi:MAG: hypothetical protein P1P60_00240 [Treponema phagedenis]|uniref:hypothetical protein n=1 Tax=Treponema phagedenis TaxID=162 RepID=UPI003133EB80